MAISAGALLWSYLTTGQSPMAIVARLSSLQAVQVFAQIPKLLLQLPTLLHNDKVLIAARFLSALRRELLNWYRIEQLQGICLNVIMVNNDTVSSTEVFLPPEQLTSIDVARLAYLCSMPLVPYCNAVYDLAAVNKTVLWFRDATSESAPDMSSVDDVLSTITGGAQPGAWARAFEPACRVFASAVHNDTSAPLPHFASWASLMYLGGDRDTALEVNASCMTSARGTQTTSSSSDNNSNSDIKTTAPKWNLRLSMGDTTNVRMILDKQVAMDPNVASGDTNDGLLSWNNIFNAIDMPVSTATGISNLLAFKRDVDNTTPWADGFVIKMLCTPAHSQECVLAADVFVPPENACHADAQLLQLATEMSPITLFSGVYSPGYMSTAVDVSTAVAADIANIADIAEPSLKFKRLTLWWTYATAPDKLPERASAVARELFGEGVRGVWAPLFEATYAELAIVMDTRDLPRMRSFYGEGSAHMPPRSIRLVAFNDTDAVPVLVHVPVRSRPYYPNSAPCYDMGFVYDLGIASSTSTSTSACSTLGPRE
jgi:hypothetical protein